MKVIDHIGQALEKKKTEFSFEILPPLKGQNIDTIFSNIDPLMEFKPPFIDVTYHREEYIYKERPDGLLEKKVVRKRLWSRCSTSCTVWRIYKRRYRKLPD